MNEIVNGAGRRKKRFREIERIIMRNPGMPTGTLLGFVEYSTGLTEARIKIYLKCLQRAGKIYEKGMKWYVRKSG